MTASDSKASRPISNISIPAPFQQHQGTPSPRLPPFTSLLSSINSSPLHNQRLRTATDRHNGDGSTQSSILSQSPKEPQLSRPTYPTSLQLPHLGYRASRPSQTSEVQAQSGVISVHSPNLNFPSHDKSTLPWAPGMAENRHDTPTLTLTSTYKWREPVNIESDSSSASQSEDSDGVRRRFRQSQRSVVAKGASDGEVTAGDFGSCSSSLTSRRNKQTSRTDELEEEYIPSPMHVQDQWKVRATDPSDQSSPSRIPRPRRDQRQTASTSAQNTPSRIPRLRRSQRQIAKLNAEANSAPVSPGASRRGSAGIVDIKDAENDPPPRDGSEDRAVRPTVKSRTSLRSLGNGSDIRAAAVDGANTAPSSSFGESTVERFPGEVHQSHESPCIRPRKSVTFANPEVLSCDIHEEKRKTTGSKLTSLTSPPRLTPSTPSKSALVPSTRPIRMSRNEHRTKPYHPTPITRQLPSTERPAITRQQAPKQLTPTMRQPIFKKALSEVHEPRKSAMVNKPTSTDTARNVPPEDILSSGSSSHSSSSGDIIVFPENRSKTIRNNATRPVNRNITSTNFITPSKNRPFRPSPERNTASVPPRLPQQRKQQQQQPAQQWPWQSDPIFSEPTPFYERQDRESSIDETESDPVPWMSRHTDLEHPGETRTCHNCGQFGMKCTCVLCKYCRWIFDPSGECRCTDATGGNYKKRG